MQFSDTIACVLFRITCLELFFVFFQHVQGSTSFSIVQFSRSCADRLSRAARLLYLIQFRLSRTFLKIFSSRSASRPAAVAFVTACLFYFIQDLLSRPFLKFFRATFQPLYRSGCPRPVLDSVAGPPRSGAIIIPCKDGTVKRFLPIFGRKYHFWRF